MKILNLTKREYFFVPF